MRAAGTRARAGFGLLAALIQVLGLLAFCGCEDPRAATSDCHARGADATMVAGCCCGSESADAADVFEAGAGGSRGAATAPPLALHPSTARNPIAPAVELRPPGFRPQARTPLRI